jgi:hypothetical protein
MVRRWLALRPGCMCCARRRRDADRLVGAAAAEAPRADGADRLDSDAHLHLHDVGLGDFVIAVAVSNQISQETSRVSHPAATGIHIALANRGRVSAGVAVESRQHTAAVRS